MSSISPNASAQAARVDSTQSSDKPTSPQQNFDDEHAILFNMCVVQCGLPITAPVMLECCLQHIMSDLEHGSTGSIKSFPDEMWTQADIKHALNRGRKLRAERVSKTDSPIDDPMNEGIFDMRDVTTLSVDERFELLFLSQQKGVAEEARELREKYGAMRKEMGKHYKLIDHNARYYRELYFD
ncbi:MAG: hypothetical protein Q9174_004408 [Haloplaca sp. 1 TL-2023]